MIEYREGREIPPEAVAELFDTVPWARGRAPERIARALAASDRVVTAWDGERLVGIARSLSDGEWYATVWDVIVHPDYRSRGIGREIVRRITDFYRGRGFSYVALFSVEGREGWYEQFGYTLHPRGMRLDEGAEAAT
ncbi:MAG: GNAT family N-acetyltransferase [Clostridia bacterium]|nr:GNAT family N-acetyltransferase [Clostridia bacterium]